MSAFDSADRLAGICGLAPVPRDSDASAATSNGPAATTIGSCAPAIWPPKALPAPIPHPAPTMTANAPRANTTDKLLALARRRLNVLWAMLRDHTPYRTSTATAA